MDDYTKNLKRWLKRTGVQVGSKVIIADYEAAKQYRDEVVDSDFSSREYAGKSVTITQIAANGKGRHDTEIYIELAGRAKLVPFFALIPDEEV